MGPIKDSNLCIAPAFYSSQVDICSPFSAYSFVNKRATLNDAVPVYDNIPCGTCLFMRFQ